MTEHIAFGRFVALNEHDAPSLLQRMSSHDLPIEGDRYGIVTRLIARPRAAVADLAAAVLKKLFETTRFNPSDLGAIVLSSRIADPATEALRVAEQLGLTCPADGIERACSGFSAATRLAMTLCQTSGMPVAVIAAEIISRNINWEPAGGDLADQKRARGQAAKLFADGAAAVIVAPFGTDCPHQILDAWQGEVPDDQKLIQKVGVEHAVDPWGNARPGSTVCISMPGRRGFWLVKRAPQIMADAVSQSVEHAKRAGHLTDESVSHIVPHQPNGLILSRFQEQLREVEEVTPNHDATGESPPPGRRRARAKRTRAQLPLGCTTVTKVWNCIENAGNTVSASIPLAMADIQHRLSPQAIVGMPSVGAGGPGYRPDVLSTGCVLVRVGPKKDV